MATNQAISDALILLTDTLQSSKKNSKDWQRVTFQLWQRKLKDIEDDILMLAIDDALDELKFVPTWSEILVYIKKRQEERLDYWRSVKNYFYTSENQHTQNLEYDWSKVESMSQKERDANLRYWKNYAKYYKEVICTEEYQKELREFLKTDKANDENATREFIDTLRKRHLEV
jgi:hypothetical protein